MTRERLVSYSSKKTFLFLARTFFPLAAAALRFFFSHARRCKSCASPLAGQSSGRVASRRAPALKPSHGGRSGTAFGHPVCRGRVTAAQSQSQGRELWTRNRGLGDLAVLQKSPQPSGSATER